jgi:hypothetical protein
VQSFSSVRCVSVTTTTPSSTDLPAHLPAAGSTLKYWDLDIRSGESQMDQRAKFHLLRMDIRHHDRSPCMYPLAGNNPPQRPLRRSWLTALAGVALALPGPASWATDQGSWTRREAMANGA